MRKACDLLYIILGTVLIVNIIAGKEIRWSYGWLFTFISIEIPLILVIIVLEIILWRRKKRN